MKNLSIFLCVLAVSCAVAGEGIGVGWRGDGSGRFPDANPPLKWGRVSEAILKLHCQAGKPKETDAGSPMQDGVIREWLVLGPRPLPADFKGYKEEILPKESALEPAENDACENLKWTKVALDSACLDFKTLFGPKLVAAGAPPAVAYAHAWIKSDAAQSLNINQMSAGKDVMFWLNGKPANAGFGYQTLPLEKGWNHLIYRVVSNPVAEEQNNSWYIRPVLFGGSDGAYKTENIAWTTRMPGLGVGGPILVGDKIIATAEMSDLICLSQKTGEILWIRSNTWYDALSEQEKKADTFAEVKGFHDAIQAANQKRVGDPALEMKLHVAMKKLNPEKFNVLGRTLQGAYPEGGFAAATPVSDGKHVFASFGNCVLACYDLEGNRKWIACVMLDPFEHGHTASPIIVGDKVLAYWSKTVAFDKETGKELWGNQDKAVGAGNLKYHGTACVFQRGDQDYIYTPSGQLLRASDGKGLLFDYLGLGLGIASPVYAEGRIYATGVGIGGVASARGVVKIVEIPEIGADKAQAKVLKEIPTDQQKFPMFYQGGFMASPLLHEGLLYCLSVSGLLSVIDVAKGELVYQKVLDIDLNVNNGGGPRRGGTASSPTLAGKYIFIFGNQGACLILKPGRKYEQVAKNRIELVVAPKHWSQHQEVTINCPVFDRTRIYCRAEENLYCIEEKR